MVQSGAMCRLCSAKLSHMLCRLCYVVEDFREGILNLKFKEMSLAISRTDLESFINFEDRLNNF